MIRYIQEIMSFVENKFKKYFGNLNNGYDNLQPAVVRIERIVRDMNDEETVRELLESVRKPLNLSDIYGIRKD